MTFTFTESLNRVSNDLAQLLTPGSLTALCQSVGLRWRRRLLDPITTIHLFLLQVLHRNTACAHLPRLTGQSFTSSAYCQARSRLPLSVLTTLLRRLTEIVRPVMDVTGLWRGHRTWFVDGTGVNGNGAVPSVEGSGFSVIV